MKSLAVIFPGQGAQSVGMGRDFFESSPAAREVYGRADAVLGFELSRICFEGPETELTRTDIQQPAIFVTSAAIWAALLERHGTSAMSPTAAAGLSLGEYSALCAAGGLTFDDGLRLVKRRGELMQEAAAARPGAMASVMGGDAEAVDALCAEAAAGEVLVPANYNCPGQIVISGSREACERAVGLSEKRGLRAMMLNVSGAFHSPLMEPAAEALMEVLQDTSVGSLSFKVMANVSAESHEGADEIRESLRRQLTHAVRWQESMERLIAGGVDAIIEVGPGRVLSGLMRKINRGVTCINVSRIAGVEIELLANSAT